MSRRHKRKHVENTRASHIRKRNHEWSVRRYRLGSADGPAYVEYLFPSEGGIRCRVCVPHSKLRHKGKLLDEVADRLPIYPPGVGYSDSDRIAFLRDLAQGTGKIEIIPSRTGFLDRHFFVTCSEIVGHDGLRKPRPTVTDPDPLAAPDVKGTLDGSKAEVLKLARKSTYLGFAIGVALAAPLPTYLRLRGEETGSSAEILLPESAVFNFSGPSSSGKSSACLAALSLGASPERAGSFDFSRRGLAEMATDANDGVMVIDDTEKGEDGSAALVAAMKTVVHMVPGGDPKPFPRVLIRYGYLCCDGPPWGSAAVQSPFLSWRAAQAGRCPRETRFG